MAVSIATRVRWAAALLLRGAEPQLQPWDYVQGLVERRLHDFLHATPEAIRAFVIVGAWRGHELRRLLPRYPNARFVCLEPAPEEYRRLAAAYESEPRVELVEAAASDTTGDASFWLPALAGTGSLLPPRSEPSPSLTVRATRLDDVPAVAALDSIDCLWLDVQGAEARVLAGAEQLLERTRSVFTEVATRGSSYEGGCSIDELAGLLEPHGFVLEELGIDPRNGEGNSLWVCR